MANNNIEYKIVQIPNAVHVKDEYGNEMHIGNTYTYDLEKIMIEYVPSQVTEEDYFYIEIEDDRLKTEETCQIIFQCGVGFIEGSTLSWSRDKKTTGTWTECYRDGVSTPITGLTDGERIYFRGTLAFSEIGYTENQYDDDGDRKFIVELDDNNLAYFKIGGRVESIYNKNFEANKNNDYAFATLFYKSGVTDISNLIFPPVLGNSTCEGMFMRCGSLTVTCPLSSTTLGETCYAGMFFECSGLASASTISFSEIGAYGCYQMFYGCELLEAPPPLLGTKLSKSCYEEAFAFCYSLDIDETYKLPSAILPNYCYYRMFAECTSLKKTPNMGISEVSEGSLKGMFEGCTSLSKTMEIVFEVNAAPYCCEEMFEGCDALRHASGITIVQNKMAYACYREMFFECTNLRTPPNISAKVMDDNCCERMFAGCSSLTYGPSAFLGETVTLADACFKEMFSGCTNLAYPDKYYEYFFDLTNTEDKLPPKCYYGMFKNCKNLHVSANIISDEGGEGSCQEMFKGCGQYDNVAHIASGIQVVYISITYFSMESSGCCFDMLKGCVNLTNLGIFTKYFDYHGDTYDIAEFNYYDDNTLNEGLHRYINAGIADGVKENGELKNYTGNPPYGSASYINKNFLGLNCCYGIRLKNIINPPVGGFMYTLNHDHKLIIRNIQSWWTRSLMNLGDECKYKKDGITKDYGDGFCHGFQTFDQHNGYVFPSFDNCCCSDARNESFYREGYDFDEQVYYHEFYDKYGGHGLITLPHSKIKTWSGEYEAHYTAYDPSRRENVQIDEYEEITEPYTCEDTPFQRE